MSNTSNKYIAVSYRLYVDGDNGKEMMEEATEEQPFHFISGFGIALDAFEKNIVNLQKDETFDFSLDKVIGEFGGFHFGFLYLICIHIRIFTNQ